MRQYDKYERALITDLADALEASEAKAERLAKCLDFYADPNQWENAPGFTDYLLIEKDSGKRAREALGGG